MENDSITIKRLLNVPRERVWAACTQIDQLAKWWGQPREARVPVFEGEVRVGGWLHFEVRLPSGTTVRVKACIRELEPPARIVIEQQFMDESGPRELSRQRPVARITLLLHDRDAQTELSVTHEVPRGEGHTVEQYTEGWAQSLDRLEGVISQ